MAPLEKASGPTYVESLLNPKRRLVLLPDQIPLTVSKDHESRLLHLPPGKHIIDIWLYKQSEDLDNPEPLAAGEFILRK